MKLIDKLKKIQKTETHVEILERKLILNKDEAIQLDDKIKSFIVINTGNLNEKLEKFICDELKNAKRYTNGINKTTQNKCERLTRMYLNNNKLWLFFEGMMCIVAYGVTILSMLDVAFRDICDKYHEKVPQEGILWGTCVLLMLVSVVLDKYKRNNEKAQLLVDVFNRFSPTIIMLTLLAFYGIRWGLQETFKDDENVAIIKCIVTTVIAVLSLLIMVWTVKSKYNKYKKYLK